MSSLPKPPSEAIVYADEWVTVCLASFPITKGHTVAVWNKPAPDLHDLSDSEYDYLMDIVDITRDVLLKTLGIEKVYLVYMDETKQVHWHLVPRYNEEGFNMLVHEPTETSDFSLAKDMRSAFDERKRDRELRFPNS